MADTAQKLHNEGAGVADAERAAPDAGSAIDGIKSASEAATALAEAIASSEAFREYEAARDAMHGDGEAKELFSEYQRRSRYLQMAGQWGGERDQDRATIEQLEKQMAENEAITRYRTAQERLVSELQELNALTTQEMGFDIASMISPSSCGCH